MDEANGTQFKVVQATPDDAEAIFRCSQKATTTSYLLQTVYPEDKAHLTPPDELFAWRVARLRKTLANEGLDYYKVVPSEEPSKVVGYCGWFKPGHFARSSLSDLNEQAVEDANAKNKPRWAGDSANTSTSPINSEQQSSGFPACMNVDAHQEFIAKMDEERKRIWGDDANFWYLGALGVDPEYQRKGIATMLLKPGLERADMGGIPTYLEATPEGAKVYPKFGFQKVNELEMFGGRFKMEMHIRPSRNGHVAS